ncbi:glycoside hydrolase family 16 protein, partial [Saccharopolyspora erythraea]
MDSSKWTIRNQRRGTHSGIDWWYKPQNVRTDGRGALAIDLGRLGPGQYSGGRVDSQGKSGYTRGSIEFRVHVPPTEGHLATVTLHYDGYGEHHQSSSETVRAPGPHGTWYHTFGLERSESSLRFRYDGQVVGEVTDPKLISRVAESRSLARVPRVRRRRLTNAPLDHTSTMYVDYVRVWQGLTGRPRAPRPVGGFKGSSQHRWSTGFGQEHSEALGWG